MNKTVARCILVATVAVWLVTLVYRPDALADGNAFMRGFVNHELLAFLGVIVTITLASAANLHLTLNQLEAAAKEKNNFPATRRAVKMSAYAMLWLLVFAFVLVVVKPLATSGNVYVEAFFNGGALVIVITNILILADLTEAAFKIR
jgi:hypothetical protein